MAALPDLPRVLWDKAAALPGMLDAKQGELRGAKEFSRQAAWALAITCKPSPEARL